MKLNYLFAVAVVVIAMVGCVSPQPPPQAAPSFAEQSGKINAAVLDSITKWGDDGMKAVQRFSAQKGCKPEAIMGVEYYMSQLGHYERLEYSPLLAQEAHNRKVSLAFAYADAAKEKGCYDMADKQYRDLINFYVGSAYSGIRDRAKIGIDDIRELRKSKPAKQ